MKNLQLLKIFKKKQCKYQTMFIFISYKIIKIGVKSTACRLMINCCSKSLFCDISTFKDGKDLLTSFSLVIFILS